MRIAFIIAAIFSVLAAPSLAFELERCNRSLDGIHVSSHDHTDHGGGLVSYKNYSHTGENESSFLVIAECTTGKTITVQTSNTDYVAPNGLTRVKFLTKLERERSIQAAFRRMLESEEEYSVYELAWKLKLPSRGRIRVEMSEKENCACASRYPEMLGKLKRFELREWD